jgi:CRISPR-associated protein Cas1
MLVLAGYGVGLRVERDSLVLKNGFTHDGQTNPTRILYRGVHGIRSIVMLADSGNISIDAIKWCHEQNITVSMLDSDGGLLQSLTVEQEASSQLRRAQYRASDNDLGSYIAVQLVRNKIAAQLATLQAHSELPLATRASEILENSLKWLDMPELPSYFYDIDYLRTYEGRNAKVYFESWQGLPLKWAKTDIKKVPPHWLTIPERTSPLAGNGRHAVNPLHAALNYAYALLDNACRSALNKYGFDATCGYLHVDKLHRDSLVYDLMELYRAKVDDKVLRLFSTITLKKGDIIPVNDGSVRLNPQLARYVVASCSLSQAEIDKGALWLKSMLLDQTNSKETRKSA